MAKMEYKTAYDSQTGEVIFTTECPAKAGAMVGSDDCRRCRYFRAITFKQQVECGRPVEDDHRFPCRITVGCSSGLYNYEF